MYILAQPLCEYNTEDNTINLLTIFENKPTLNQLSQFIFKGSLEEQTEKAIIFLVHLLSGRGELGEYNNEIYDVFYLFPLEFEEEFKGVEYNGVSWRKL